MEPLAEKALRAVETGELTILPERFEKVLLIMFVEKVNLNWTSPSPPSPRRGKKKNNLHTIPSCLLISEITWKMIRGALTYSF